MFHIAIDDIILIFINLLCCIVSALLLFLFIPTDTCRCCTFSTVDVDMTVADAVIANGTHVLYPSNDLMPCCKNSFGVVSVMISYISFYHGLCLLPSKPRSTIQDVILHLFRVLLETNIFPCLLLALYMSSVYEYDTLPRTLHRLPTAATIVIFHLLSSPTNLPHPHPTFFDLLIPFLLLVWSFLSLFGFFVSASSQTLVADGKSRRI